MADTRLLRIDSTARSLTAAAGAQAAKTPLATGAPGMSAGGNVFGAAALGFNAWACLVHEALSGEAQVGDTALGAVSATGFAALDAINEKNAEDLSAARVE